MHPPRSICFVCGPASDLIFAESPVAVMRSPRIARACTYGCAASLVKIFPLSRIMSGGNLLGCRERRYCQSKNGDASFD